MLGWFKRKDDFEWKKYVRTTVRLKRQDRKRKLVAAKGAVVDGVKVASVASVSAGGSLARRTWVALTSSVGAVVRGARSGVALVFHGLVMGLVWLGGLGGKAFAPLQPIFRNVSGHLGRQPVRLGLALAAGAATLWGLSRYRAQGLDTEVSITAAVALGCVAALVLPLVIPPIAKALTPVVRTLSGMLKKANINPMLARGAAVAAALVAAIVGGLYWMGRSSGPVSIASLPSMPRLGLMGPPEVSGRAMAVAGDTIRLDGRLFGLIGIEAPLLGQRCQKGANKNWRCGVAATEALNQKIRREIVTCAPTGREERGRQMARCRIGTEDLAGLLVKEGAVFASSGLFSQYGSLEGQAKTQKVGLWSGDVERPDVWRTRLYEDAKKRAPNQCPVKGVKGSTGLRYVMPWEEDYEKVRVREGRGERWFCSEQEAQSAGYRIAS